MLKAEEMNESELTAYTMDYLTVRELVRDMEEKQDVTLCVYIPKEGYTDLGTFFPDHTGIYLNRILNDLKVYMIELRREIRDILDMDEIEATGTVTGDPEKLKQYEPEPLVIPKNDYRRHGQEVKDE